MLLLAVIRESCFCESWLYSKKTQQPNHLKNKNKEVSNPLVPVFFFFSRRQTSQFSNSRDSWKTFAKAIGISKCNFISKKIKIIIISDDTKSPLLSYSHLQQWWHLQLSWAMQAELMQVKAFGYQKNLSFCLGNSVLPWSTVTLRCIYKWIYIFLCTITYINAPMLYSY